MVERSSITGKKDIIAELLADAYTKAYKMRLVGPGSLEATIPRAIVEREARRYSLSVEEFIQVYRVEYLFDDFGGAFLRFRKAAEQSDVTKEPDHASETKDRATHKRTQDELGSG